MPPCMENLFLILPFKYRCWAQIYLSKIASQTNTPWSFVSPLSLLPPQTSPLPIQRCPTHPKNCIGEKKSSDDVSCSLQISSACSNASLANFGFLSATHRARMVGENSLWHTDHRATGFTPGNPCSSWASRAWLWEWCCRGTPLQAPMVSTQRNLCSWLAQWGLWSHSDPNLSAPVSYTRQVDINVEGGEQFLGRADGSILTLVEDQLWLRILWGELPRRPISVFLGPWMLSLTVHCAAAISCGLSAAWGSASFWLCPRHHLQTTQIACTGSCLHEAPHLSPSALKTLSRLASQRTRLACRAQGRSPTYSWSHQDSASSAINLSRKEMPHLDEAILRSSFPRLWRGCHRLRCR